ncbi:hypothetical protein R1flu_021016 [Riccia fluitans]|uniref:Uncharacterized protein n=1 Tax=Riccia fluitans TaxID=41844 RepID=A0ABD1ZN73_9MARC
MLVVAVSSHLTVTQCLPEPCKQCHFILHAGAAQRLDHLEVLQNTPAVLQHSSEYDAGEMMASHKPSCSKIVRIVHCQSVDRKGSSVYNSRTSQVHQTVAV